MIDFDLYDIITFAVIVVLIFFVGFFTSSETAYISLSKIKLRRMQEEGKKKAKLVEMPVELNYTRGQSFGRIKFKDVWKMFTDTWKIWWNLRIKKNYFK